MCDDVRIKAYKIRPVCYYKCIATDTLNAIINTCLNINI